MMKRETMMTRMKMNFKLYERYNGRLDLRDVLFKQVKLKLSFPAMMDFKGPMNLICYTRTSVLPR